MGQALHMDRQHEQDSGLMPSKLIINQSLQTAADPR